MTQEEKDLLLRDLCARLPYGVKVKDTHSGHYGRLVRVSVNFSDYVSELNYNTLYAPICYIKPYLRPMSSMTEEEKNVFKQYIYHFDSDSLPNYEGEFVFVDEISDLQDWFNAHHFDYCGLIEKGLALEALEGLYSTKD